MWDLSALPDAIYSNPGAGTVTATRLGQHLVKTFACVGGGWHEVHYMGGIYQCIECGWSAEFDRRAEAWYVLMPYLIYETP